MVMSSDIVLDKLALNARHAQSFSASQLDL